MQTRYLATQASTHGRLGLYRVDMGPEQAGPGPHFHRTMSEAFFILSGALRLFDGDQWIDGTAGDFFYIPEGGVHAFRDESRQPVSMLMPKRRWRGSLSVTTATSCRRRIGQRYPVVSGGLPASWTSTR
jgi:mannose-6-phosphate isomerase-like protein (cupin superfamily)